MLSLPSQKPVWLSRSYSLSETCINAKQRQLPATLAKYNGFTYRDNRCMLGLMQFNSACMYVCMRADKASFIQVLFLRMRMHVHLQVERRRNTLHTSHHMCGLLISYMTSGITLSPYIKHLNISRNANV